MSYGNDSNWIEKLIHIASRIEIIFGESDSTSRPTDIAESGRAGLSLRIERGCSHATMEITLVATMMTRRRWTRTRRFRIDQGPLPTWELLKPARVKPNYAGRTNWLAALKACSALTDDVGDETRTNQSIAASADFNHPNSCLTLHLQGTSANNSNLLSPVTRVQAV